MQEKVLRPAAGARVRKPDGSLVDPAGEPLAMTSYVARRLADGDLEEVPADEPAGKAQSKGARA